MKISSANWILAILAFASILPFADVPPAIGKEKPLCEGSGLEQVAKVDLKDARRFMSNVTYRNVSAGHGNQIEHATADGRVFLWYPGNNVILPGKWKLIEQRQNNGACVLRSVSLCFQYGANTYNPVTGSQGAEWECGEFGRFRSGRAEVVPGDPLGLQRMSVPPFLLPRTDQSIAQIAIQMHR